MNNVNAHELKKKITEESLNKTPEFQSDGTYLSPAYIPVAIHYSDIINQAANPNSQTDKAFKALQTSILNTGYLFPVIVSENPLYNPNADMSKKPDLREIRNGGRVVEVRDPSIRQYFKYQIVDGSHRFSALLVNDEIYERENGFMPCTLLRNKNEQELMSCEILMNSSRGTHALDSMKEIVADLIASGMSEEWIATNLFLDKEAIGRYKQLSGLATAFRSEGDFSENVWDPRKDNLQERKDATKLNQLARAYVRKWKELANVGGNNHDIPPTVDLLTAAKNLGFDVNNPYIIPVKVDPETGEVEETALVENKEV